MEILRSDEILEVSKEVLGTFCDTEGKKCSELDMFATCVRWAEEQCRRSKNLKGTPEDLRNVLGQVLTKIKFEKMSVDDFMEFVVPLELLPNEQVGQLITDWQKHKKHKCWKEVVKVNITICVSI